jgi:hypothetical protein
MKPRKETEGLGFPPPAGMTESFWRLNVVRIRIIVMLFMN